MTCRALNVARPFLVSLLVLAPVLAGCKSKSNMPAEIPASGVGSSPQPAPPVNPAVAGNVVGTIHFKGTPPPRVQIDMSMDPACAMAAGENLSEQYVVNNGGLANVFVYLKSGLPGSSAPKDAPPVRIDQKGCRFVPHVAAVQQGGLVEFTNSDPTMHNVHTVTVGGNPSIDVSQGPGAQPQVRRFDTPENMIRIGCNNHPWMNAFLNVAPNPYFAVTGPDGRFSIRGLPPGTYTLAAVHEKLGEQDVQVTVPAHGTATADLSFAIH